MPRLPGPIVLTGTHVRLEPLSLDHVDALVAAASVDRATYGYTNVPDGHDDMERYVRQLLDAADDGTVRPFAQVRLADDTVVGCTRYMEPHHWRGRPEPDEIEVGGTWLAADTQRTPLNTEAKYLLLRHAFETWGVWRLALCTDARNERSRAAIARIGATFEGVLRHHRPVNAAGRTVVEPRDTAVFSVIDTEWPDVRARLEARLR